MKIGVVAAMASELLPFIEQKVGCEIITVGARKVYHVNANGNSVYVAESGIGEIAMASAVQFLFDMFGIDLLVNFGLAGALTNGFSAGETCVVESVVHYDFDTSAIDDIEPARYEDMDSAYMPTTAKYVDVIANKLGFRRVKCASGDKFIDGEQRRNFLWNSWHTEICEMESAGVVRVSHLNGVDCVIIKTVSDSNELSYTETKLLACKAFSHVVDKILGVIG